MTWLNKYLWRRMSSPLGISQGVIQLGHMGYMLLDFREYFTLPYSLQTGSFTELGTRLVAGQLQRSSNLYHPKKIQTLHQQRLQKYTVTLGFLQGCILFYLDLNSVSSNYSCLLNHLPSSIFLVRTPSPVIYLRDIMFLTFLFDIAMIF